MFKRMTAMLVALAVVLATTISAFGAEENVTLYYYNSDGWDSVSAYTWEPNEQFGGWPGSEATDLGDGWWSIVLPVYMEWNPIIFNNSGEGSQNSDLNLEPGKFYIFGSRDTEEGVLSYDEAVALFGSAPAADAPAAPQANPPTGEGPTIAIAIGVLLVSGLAALLISRKVKAQ